MQQYTLAPTQKGFQRAMALPPGNSFVRALAARLISRVLNVETPREVASRMWPNDRVVDELLTRANSAPAMTTVPNWAGALATLVVTDMAMALGPYSAGAQLLIDSLLMSWNGAGHIGVPAFIASSNNASFVKEGDPIPVRQFSATNAFLNPYKIATIVAMTREMVESSNIEALVKDTLIKSAGLTLDSVLFSANGVSSAAPAGLLFNIPALPASSNADPFGSVFEDVQALIAAVSAVGGAGPYYIIGSAANVASMAMRFGEIIGVIRPVISGAVGNNLIAVAAQAVAAALDPTPDLETAKAGTLVMDDNPGSAGTTNATEKSLFQTDSLAIKMRWPVSWILRDARGVAWTTPVWK